MKSHTLPHLPALDGVRGLAILLVVLVHSALINRIHFIDKIWHGIVFAGWAGVDLFFVLSGFLITRILVAEKQKSNFLFSFYARRVLRIFPLYYLFLFLTFTVFQVSAHFEFTYWTFLSNILISRLGYFPSAVLDVTWSLAVEEQFYIFWPFIVLFLNRKNLIRTCKALFCLALILRLTYFFSGSNLLTNYVLLPTRMDSLVGGAWLAISVDSLPKGLCKKYFWRLIPLVVLVFSLDVSHSAPAMQTVGFSLNALASVFLMGSVIKNEIRLFELIFKLKTLRVLGKYSYGMYLFHVPITLWILKSGKFFWDSAGIKVGANLPVQILFHLLVIIATLGCAFVSYHLFEKHFLRLKRFFSSEPPSKLSEASALN